MHKIAIALAAAGLFLAGCDAAMTPGERAGVGALVGGATGAAIGGAATESVGGAVAGGLLGAGAGGLIGAATTPRYCVTYDAYGRPYQYRC